LQGSLQGWKASAIFQRLLQSKGTPDVATWSRRTGLSPSGGLNEANRGDFFVKLKSAPRRSIFEVMTEVRSLIETEVPGLNVEMAQLMEDLIGDPTALSFTEMTPVKNVENYFTVTFPMGNIRRETIITPAAGIAPRNIVYIRGSARTATPRSTAASNKSRESHVDKSSRNLDRYSAPYLSGSSATRSIISSSKLGLNCNVVPFFISESVAAAFASM
jgi:hypothetical protein